MERIEFYRYQKLPSPSRHKKAKKAAQPTVTPVSPVLLIYSLSNLLSCSPKFLLQYNSLAPPPSSADADYLHFNHLGRDLAERGSAHVLSSYAFLEFSHSTPLVRGTSLVQKNIADANQQGAMPLSDVVSGQEERQAAGGAAAASSPAPTSPAASATVAPPPFERRASLNGSSSTRIYPIKSVAHPSMRARRNSAATSASGPLSPRPLSPVESLPSSTGAKPPSLDPFLPEPTSHAKAEHAAAEEGASSAGGSLQSENQLFMSERFEHQEGEDGDHYIVTGRNGQIERCEDEVSGCRRPFDLRTIYGC